MCALVFLLSAAAPAAAAPAPSWRPAIERACVMKYGQARRHWPQWARCVIDRLYGKTAAARSAYAACWAPIWDRRLREGICDLCGDPVLATVTCVQRALGR